MVNGAMVDYLQKRFVFVCDVDVVQIDQTVGASRQQNVWVCGVELKLETVKYNYIFLQFLQNLPQSHHHCEFRHISAGSLPVLEYP